MSGTRAHELSTVPTAIKWAVSMQRHQGEDRIRSTRTPWLRKDSPSALACWRPTSSRFRCVLQSSILKPGGRRRAGRRVTMAKQLNMAAVDERGPGFLGIIGGEGRRDDQRNRKHEGSEPTELADNARCSHGILLARIAPAMLDHSPLSGCLRQQIPTATTPAATHDR